MTISEAMAISYEEVVYRYLERVGMMCDMPYNHDGKDTMEERRARDAAYEDLTRQLATKPHPNQNGRTR